MNNELKEILDDLVVNETTGMCYLSIKLTKQVKDYITNLQEENEMYAQLKDEYEDIIDKAIEYGKELRLFDNESLEFEIGTNFINILQGEDKDVKD